MHKDTPHLGYFYFYFIKMNFRWTFGNSFVERCTKTHVSPHPTDTRAMFHYRDHTCFFHALTFVGSRGSCLNTRPLGRVFKHRPRDPASVNAMKQTCVIVILAYLTWFQHKPRWKRRLNIKYPFSYTWYLKTKWRQRQLSNVITSPRIIYTRTTF